MNLFSALSLIALVACLNASATAFATETAPSAPVEIAGGTPIQTMPPAPGYGYPPVPGYGTIPTYPTQPGYPNVPGYPPLPGTPDQVYPPGYDPIYQWCDQVAYQLEMDLQQANMIYMQSQPRAAIEFIMASLQRAAASASYSGNLGTPFTRSLIDRALRYGQMLMNGASAETSELAATYHFLSRNVTFIAQTARGFDQQFFIPSMYYRRHCNTQCAPGYMPLPSWDPVQFNAQFVSLAASQLDLVVQSLTTSNYGMGVAPIGSPRVFMRAVAMVTREIAGELRANLFAYQNACVIVGLEQLSYRVSLFNQTGAGYPNIRYAMNVIVPELQTIAADLASPYPNCNR